MFFCVEDFTALATYLSQFGPSDPFLRVASDFHFLLFLAGMDIVPIRNYLGPLLDAIRHRKADVAEEWAKSDFWQTVSRAQGSSHLSLISLSPF
jgi:nuclear protein localization family protein 4